MTKIDFISVNNSDQIRVVSELAEEIMLEHYSSYIPVDHIKFFLSEFQTPIAIQKQIDSSFEYYLISFEGIFVGYIGLDFQIDKVLLSKLYILEKYRGKKIGLNAMQFVDRRCKEKDIATIDLFVNIQNDRGISVYEENGFKKIEIVPYEYGNGHVEQDWLMRKVIF